MGKVGKHEMKRATISTLLLGLASVWLAAWPLLLLLLNLPPDDIIKAFSDCGAFLPTGSHFFVHTLSATIILVLTLITSALLVVLEFRTSSERKRFISQIVTIVLWQALMLVALLGYSQPIFKMHEVVALDEPIQETSQSDREATQETAQIPAPCSPQSREWDNTNAVPNDVRAELTNEPLTLGLVDVPISDVARLLTVAGRKKDRTHLRFAASSVAATATVSVAGTNTTALAVLDAACGQADAFWQLYTNGVFIFDREEATSLPQYFPIGKSPSQPTWPEAPYDRLRSLISQGWDGPGIGVTKDGWVYSWDVKMDGTNRVLVPASAELYE